MREIGRMSLQIDITPRRLARNRTKLDIGLRLLKYSFICLVRVVCDAYLYT